MSRMPNFNATTSIQVFCQIPGITTEKILANCLYAIDDPEETREIVDLLNPVELYRATQRKATNWLVFRLRDLTRLTADLDQEAAELRLTSGGSTREFKISEQASKRLADHLQRARPLYEAAHGR